MGDKLLLSYKREVFMLAEEPKNITLKEVAIKKNEILPFVTTCTDLDGIMLSEISQTEIEKCYMISLKCGTKRNPNE